MRIPITGNTDAFDIVLEEGMEEKLRILQRRAHSSKERFRFCNWIRHFWGSTEGGIFKNGEGFRSGCQLEAMLAYWLSRFIFTDFPYEHVQQRTLPLAVMLATGARLPLAPLFLGHLYRMLDLISNDEKDGAGRYGVDSLVSSVFLQVFIWERFKDSAVEPTAPEFVQQLEEVRKNFSLIGFPLCSRWFRKKG